MKNQIDISKAAQKSLSKLPKHIIQNFWLWAKMVTIIGIKETRKRPGYHDEPLSGNRIGQRSVRLSKAYRIIYTEEPSGEITIISVKEINKHDY